MQNLKFRRHLKRVMALSMAAAVSLTSLPTTTNVVWGGGRTRIGGAHQSGAGCKSRGAA